MQHRISLILYSKKELATAFWVSARLFSCWGVQQPKERSKGLYCFHLQPLWFPPIFSSLMLRYSISLMYKMYYNTKTIFCREFSVRFFGHYERDSLSQIIFVFLPKLLLFLLCSMTELPMLFIIIARKKSSGYIEY